MSSNFSGPGDLDGCYSMQISFLMQLPITTKLLPSSSQKPGSPPSFYPPHEDPSMAASSPCIVPCCAAQWPQLDVYACMPLPQQQQLPPQQQQQSHHAMQQQQQQQQCWSHSSQHTSSGLAAQASAPQPCLANHADMTPHGYSDRGEDELSSPMSLAAQHEQLEHRGQTSASRAVSSTQEATGRQQEPGRGQQKALSKQQESCMQQDTQGTLGREGTVVGEGRALAQASSRPFLDGLRPCSPSERCSPEAAARASHLLTGWLHLDKVLGVLFHGGSVQPYRTLQWVVRGCTAFCLCGLAHQHIFPSHIHPD